MKPNHFFRRISLFTFGTCIIAGQAMGAAEQLPDGIWLDTVGNTYLVPYSTGTDTSVALDNYVGGITLYSGVNASSPTSVDGGVTLIGNPVSIVLSGEYPNHEIASFAVWKNNAWVGSTTPLFKIDGANGNTTFTGSNVSINSGSLSVAGSPVLTSASAVSQNFVQLGSGGVLNITATTLSTSSTTGAITVAGGIGVAKDASINSLTVGRGPGGALTNTVFGRNAFEANAGGLGNTAVGNFAMKSATTAYYNTALGSNALQSTVTGGSNVAVGSSALNANTGSGNVATGYNALAFKTTGFSNVAVGHRAGEQQSDNSNLVTSSESIFIGAGTKGSTAGSTNSIVIGTSSVSDGPNTTVIGNSSTLSTRLEGETKSESLRVSGNTVLEGDTVLEGSVTLADAQGDISMGDYQ